MGLKVKQHLGHSITALYSSFLGLKSKFDFNVCGEGGEYETCVFDCPLFKQAIRCETRMNQEAPDAQLVEIDPNDFAPVAFIKFTTANCTLVDKDQETLDRHAQIMEKRKAKIAEGKDKYVKPEVIEEESKS